MRYFVTGATGFIGKRLVKKLLGAPRRRRAFLLPPGKRGQARRRCSSTGAIDGEQPAPCRCSATSPPGSWASPPTTSGGSRARSITSITWPPSTTCRPTPSRRSPSTSRARATVVEFAKAIDAGHLHHVSSIAAAGLYEGVFREDMFEEAEGLDHPYFMTKHESEKIVRKESKVPWTVYRPAMVVGDSQTGEMDKIDGPYYFFKLIQRMRQLLPPWMPAVGLEGGRVNIVPVDFVVAALDHISHLKTDIDKRCFHLVDPVGYRVGDVLDTL